MLSIPNGFQFAGVRCGLKTKAGVEDLMLIHCPDGAVGAGVGFGALPSST